MSGLADLNTERGLPRGRGALAPEEVARVQRERLLRATVAAVAELGYANARVADIVNRARASRQSFYEQFADKESCFLAAHAHGLEVILERLGRWARDQAESPPTAQLRGGI